jgi:hypothetical protein
MLLTPEAYQRIRIDDLKTDKKPSERLRDLIKEIEERTGSNFRRVCTSFFKKIDEGHVFFEKMFYRRSLDISLAHELWKKEVVKE